MSQFSLKMDIADNRFFTAEPSPLFSRAEAQKARAFHKKLAGYEPTPLCDLKDLAAYIGVKNILVKDESKRFGLNAFKMLGGVYAIANLLCEKYGVAVEDFSFDLIKRTIKEPMTFATTTDGNHGRGVAWAAKQVGQHAVVYMPKGSAQERVDHILNLGAECIVTDMNYDDTVRLTMKMAEERGWHIVQDTAWEGYTKIPTWIMQGYSTLADEAVEQMQAMGIKQPTHVLLQAGVGALAGGVLGYLVDCFGAKNLHSIVVEPDQADCIYRSGVAGEMVNVGATCAPSWPVLPAVNPIRSAGRCSEAAPPSSSPATTRCRHWACGCWATLLAMIRASSPVSPARLVPACWRQCVTTRIARR